VRPLADRQAHGDGVHVLVALLVEALCGALADNRDHRRVVHVGVGEAGHQVGDAGAEGRQAHPRLARQPPIDVGDKGRGLFMPAQHELDLAVHQRDHQVGVLLARDAEDAFDALGLETAHEQVGRLHCFDLLLRCCCHGLLPIRCRSQPG